MSRTVRSKNNGKKTVTTGFAVVEISSRYAKNAIYSMGDKNIRCKMDKPTSITLKSNIFDEIAELMQEGMRR